MLPLKYDYFSSFPKFDLDDIILREIDINRDYREYYNYMTHEKVKEFVSENDLPRSLETAKEDIAYWQRLFPARRSFYWAIALKSNNKIIGTCGFNIIQFFHKRADISYDLNCEYWGQGIMHKSLEKIINFLQTAVGIKRIQATVAIDNFKSSKVVERLGFEKEGYMKQYEYLHGVHKDFYLFAKIK